MKRKILSRPMRSRHAVGRAVLVASASFLTVTPLLAAPPAAPAVRPLAYRLDLTVLPEQPHFRGHVEIDIALQHAAQTIAIDGAGLHVTGVELRQGTSRITGSYREIDEDGHARLDLARKAAAGRATLVLDYDAPIGDDLAGLYRASVADRWYVWSHFESRHARQAFPSFDRPQYKTPFTVTLTTAPGQVAISNGPEQSQSTTGALVRHQFAPTRPLPTYLIAFAVGPFAVSTTTIAPDAQRTRAIPLRIVSPREAADRHALALAQTGPILGKLETFIGRDYPFAKLDQIASPLMFGAMENAAAIIYAQDDLLPATPGSSAAQRAFVRDVSHELSHQWFGDLVSPKSWSDLWLNESFANWMSYTIGDAWRPELQIGTELTIEGLDGMRIDELAASHPVHVKVGEDEEGSFDAITYGKGSQVLAMIANYMGEDVFRKGLQDHVRRFADRNADTDDFFASLARSARDPKLSAALRSFVDQPGVPLVRFERTPTGFRVSQSRYARLGSALPPERWTIPICYRTEQHRTCVMLDGASIDVTERSAVSIMPNADGKGYYRFALSDADWSKLIATMASQSPAEALMTTDSLWATFGTGELNPGLLKAAATPMARNPFARAAVDPGKRFAELRSQGMIPSSAHQAYAQWLHATYRSVLDRLGLRVGANPAATDTPQQDQLRLEIERLLAMEGDEPDLQAMLADAAVKAMNGQADALATPLLIPGYAAYARADLKERVPALLARAVGGSADREDITYALGEAVTGPWTAWLLDHLGDQGLTSADRRHVLLELGARADQRKAALGWIATHRALLPKGGGFAGFFDVAKNACSRDEADAFAAAFQPAVAGQPMTRPQYDAVMEGITACIALRERRGEAVAALFASSD